MANNGHRAEAQRVLVAGGGIAGVETALALRDLAGDRVEIELCDPRREFTFRPFAVGEPYGSARIFRCDLRRMAVRCDALLRADGVVSVEAESQVAVTRDGECLPYDHLVIASGARMLWAVPGAVTFWGVADEGQVGEVIAELRAGMLRHLVITMPAGHSWTLPLYELALLGATERAKAGIGRTRITVVTPEDAPLELFGGRASEQMSELLGDRDIEVVAGAHPVEFDAGCLRFAPEGEIVADAVISLPRLEGRRIAGIPHDSEGFVGVDEHGRAPGLDRAFAAGDVTAFPVKLGGVATQQADAVAESIAADAGADVDPRAFEPILRGVLWTGSEPRYVCGRPTGGDGESSLSERPQWPAQGGKVIGRYMTSLLGSLDGEADPSESISSASPC